MENRGAAAFVHTRTIYDCFLRRIVQTAHSKREFFRLAKPIFRILHMLQLNQLKRQFYKRRKSR